MADGTHNVLEKGLPKCHLCGKGPRNGIDLRRISGAGEVAKWACREHESTDAHKIREEALESLQKLDDVILALRKGFEPKNTEWNAAINDFHNIISQRARALASVPPKEE